MTATRTTWPVSTFKHLGTWYGGGTPSKANSEFWMGGSIPWLSPKDMGPDVLPGTQDLITEAAVTGSAVRLVPAGSVALVVRSGILERTLPVGYVPFGTTLNQDMKAVVPRPDIDARWIAWGFRSREQQLLRDCRKAGTTVASIEMPRFLQESLPVPPIEEQRRIVDVLEDHLSRLEAAESDLVAASDRSRALMISDAMWSLTGGGAAVGHDAISFGGRVIPVPDGWRGSTVGAEASLVQYGTSAKASELHEPNSVPVLRMGNLLDGFLIVDKLKYLPRDHPDVESLLLRQGDVLFNRTNSADLVGKTAVFDQADDSMAFASYLLRVRFGAAVRPEWANMVINSPLGRAHVAAVASQQVGQANVNGTKLKAFPLLVPPTDVQELLLARHIGIVDGARRLTADVGRARDRARTLRHALLLSAFSGRLTGSSVDVEITEELAGV